MVFSESDLSLIRLEAKRKFAAYTHKQSASDGPKPALLPGGTEADAAAKAPPRVSPLAVAPLLNLGHEDGRSIWAVLLLGLCFSICAPQLDVFSSVPTISWPQGHATWTTTTSFSPPEADEFAELKSPLWLVSWQVEPSRGAAVAMFCFAALIWSIWESVKFPRHISASNKYEVLRMFMQFWGDLFVAPVYAISPAEVPLVQCQKTPENDTILERCPSLSCFKPSSLLRNPNLSFALLLCRDFSGNDPKLVRREHVHCKDGGIVALDWWAETEAPAGANVLFIASTFTGDALNTATRDLCRHFASRGWRCVVMVKRGCGLTMPNPQPEGRRRSWCLGGQQDLELAIDHVTDIYPGVPVCGIGLSLGGTQLRKYTNATAEACKLKACVIVDGGDSFLAAFKSCDRRLPHIAGVLNQAAAATLTQCGHAPLKAPKDKMFPSLWDLARDGLAPINGYSANDEGVTQYLLDCDAGPTSGCQRPLLEMCTFNDTLVDIEAVQKLTEMYRESPHVVTCATRGGTHIIRWEGVRATCWVSRASYEFLNAALAG